MISISRNDILTQRTKPAKNMDDFIKMYPKPVQIKLQQMRRLIKSAAPKAEETILVTGCQRLKLMTEPLSASRVLKIISVFIP